VPNLREAAIHISNALPEADINQCTSIYLELGICMALFLSATASTIVISNIYVPEIPSYLQEYNVIIIILIFNNNSITFISF